MMQFSFIKILKSNFLKKNRKNFGKLPNRQSERHKIFCDEYRSGGVCSVVQLILQNISHSRPIFRARMFLEAGNAIKSLHNFEKTDLLTFALLAYDSDSSEEIRRGHAWLLLQSGQYALALEHSRYIKNNNDYHSSWDKIFEISSQKVEKNIQVEINPLKNYSFKKDFLWLKDLVVPSMLANSELFFREILVKSGLEGIDVFLNSLSGSDRFIAARYVYVSKLLSLDGDIEGAKYLLNKALFKDLSEPTLRGVYWVSKRLGDEASCERVLLELEKLLNLTTDSKVKDTYKSLYKDFHDSFKLETITRLLSTITTEEQYEPINGKICYLVHNSLPYSTGGYATRSHGLLKSLINLGVDIEIFSRPGYPLDIVKNIKIADINLADKIDNVLYNRIIGPQRNLLSQKDYLTQSVDALLEKMKIIRPSVIISASNYTTAFPALIVAKKLGIPFLYEVRGFWEITRLSKDPAFEKHYDFKIQKNLESFIARNSDHVLTLTGGMKQELIERGVISDKITLFPNSCDPNEFKVLGKNEELLSKLNIPKDIPVIGYIGSFVSYEGLDDLVEACILLKEKGYEFRLLIVGNENASGQERGPVTQQIIDISVKGKILDWLILPGRIPYSEVEDYYSIIDITPFPRKAWPICEIVSPMKPLEALATGKAIIVSSVDALTEIIEDGRTGLVFEKGSIESLANKIALLLDNEQYRQALSSNGREWLEKNRSWEITTTIVSRLLINYVKVGI